MPIVGLGTDLARVARFRKFVEDQKTALLERLFTLGERQYAFAKADPSQHLAARFAAKESCLKAFGTGWRDGISWHDMEVIPDELGRHVVRHVPDPHRVVLACGNIDEKEIPKVYAVMKKRLDAPMETQTWNRRYRDYMEKIKTGSLYDVAEVFRDLSLLKLTKDLSFGERKLYDTAQTLLVMELSTARDTDEQTIISEIELLFEKETAESADDSDK